MKEKNKIPPITALFVRYDSIYKRLGIDCYDRERNALTWRGGGPVICHPPCRSWGQLTQFAKPEPGEKWLAVWSIIQIRRWGGVLEHPRTSRLWKKYLPMPGTTDMYGGYTINIDQFWFGHKAKKNTLLYIVGCPRQDLPPIPLRFDAIEHVVSSSTSGKKEISKADRERTPERLAIWLIEVAKKCKTKTIRP